MPLSMVSWYLPNALEAVLVQTVPGLTKVIQCSDIYAWLLKSSSVL